MIYRLWNTKEKRYATAGELKYLRVNESGAVERVILDEYEPATKIGKHITVIDEGKWYDESNYYPVHYILFWQPAPEWEAEWGVMLSDPKHQLKEDSYYRGYREGYKHAMCILAAAVNLASKDRYQVSLVLPSPTEMALREKDNIEMNITPNDLVTPISAKTTGKTTNKVL